MKNPSGQHKTVHLLRHCVAMPAENADDAKRALAPRGKEDAIALGKAMGVKEYAPSLALCSPALRTQQTLEGVQERIKVSEVRSPDILYTGSPGDYLAEIQKVDDAHSEIILVAHNPSVAQLAKVLIGSGGQSLVQRLKEKYDPGTLTTIVYTGASWADIQPGENEIVDLIDPLDYNAPSTPARWT